MRYTEERNREINKKLNSIKRKILITNMKSEAHKLLKNDGKVDDNYKDFNDLKDDEFKRKALFNEYARKIIGTYGNITELEERLSLEGSDLIHYFLNNYPRVLQEIKMYSAPTVDNLYNVIRKLYNREVQELDMLDDRNAQDENVQTSLGLLKKISNNLKELRKFADTNKQHEILDLQYKFDAVMQALENVDNGVQFMGQLFQMNYSDVQSSLQKDAEDTTPTTDPNAVVPGVDTPLATPISGAIKKLTQVYDSLKRSREEKTDIKDKTSKSEKISKKEQQKLKQERQKQKQKEDDAEEGLENLAQPQPQTPFRTGKKSIQKDESFYDQENYDEGNDEVLKPRFVPTTDIMDNNLIDDAETLIKLDSVSTRDFAEYIAQVFQESINTVKSKGSNKKALFAYLKREIGKRREIILQKDMELKRQEDMIRENEEREIEKKTQNERQSRNIRNAQLKDARERKQELETALLYLASRRYTIQNKRQLYNKFQNEYSNALAKTIISKEMSSNLRQLLTEYNNIIDTIENS
jgi:hypothetical protein